MDDGRSVHTNHTRATAHWEIEPHKIPLPPSILDDNVDRRNDLEKIDKPTEPKEPKELQHRNVDDDTRFWQTYVSEAGKFDKELIESWNDNLDSLLLFAALFSAINTAFIIESYKRLQPDGTDSTNLLLRLILEHRNDNEPIPDENLTNGHWRPDSGAVRVNATLFASLACSLLASFGAILGKEMLAEYKSSGALSTLPEQGRTRQRKYDGLKRFRFRLLMQLLPIMLQLSLGLFLMGIIDFLWQMSIEVAIVILVPVVVGLIAYIVSVAVAIHWEDSPFQTSLSKSLRLLSPNVKEILRSFKKSAHNIQTFIVTQPPIMWNHICRQAQPIEDIRSRILTSPRWLAVSSKFDPITQIFDGSGITRIVKQILGNIISHICRLGVVGWWKQLDIKVWMTVYICGLGVVGWFAIVWEFLMSRMGLSAGKTGESPQEDTMTDVISSDCAVWLLENSQDTEVLHKALETLPLLPADIILKRFKTQPKILERYVLLYKSTLQRRPGDVDFRLDGVRMKDTIVAGTALFHVLKSRQEEDWSDDRWILFGADPELFDAVEDVERLAKLDFSLLTVFLCVQTQSGMGGVGFWDFDLLHALLERFLATMRSKSLMMEPIDISAPKSDSNSLSPTTPSITLLLDAGIFMVSQKYFQMPGWKLLDICSNRLESILITIHSILEEHPTSMTLTSHVSLLIAAVQWFKRKDEIISTVEGKELEFNGVKLSQLRKAWFAVDKRAEFFDNIILAFNLVGSLDTAATINIYLDLLRLTEHFMPKVMETSSKHTGWRKWWSKVVLILPGLLRLQREVDVHAHPEASQTMVRIIARLIPDDWCPFYEHAANEISKSENAPILVISPRHPEHGLDMIGLISSVLSSFGTLASPKTRKSVGEVLGWMVICPGVVGDLPLLVDNPSGMYQQFTAVPTLLISFLVNSNTHYTLHLHHYRRLLRMTPQGQLGSRVQLEALVLAMTHIPEHLSIFKAILALLNRMVVSEENFSWPVSFLEPKLVDWVLQGEGTSQKRVLQLQIIGGPWEFLYSQLTQVWFGEALMMIWRKLSNQEHFDAMDFQYMLIERTILTVLNSLEVAVILNHQISYQTMDDYLEKVLDLGWVGAVLKERIDRAKALLKVAIAEGWETLVLRQISEKEAEDNQTPEPPAIEA